MDFVLVVVRAFGPHAIGDTIDERDDDGAAIRAVLASEHAADVVRIAARANNSAPSARVED